MTNYKFGASPPRSIDSFGVAGLLQEDCFIFYESVFTTTHVGRISDLLSARLKKAGPDELRLRALILLSCFESYRSQISQQGWYIKSDRSLKEPLIIECGIDAEKIAIGVSFNLSNASLVRLEGLSARLEERDSLTPFEELLARMLPHADRLVLRHQSDISRFEVVTLLALPGRISSELMIGDKFFSVEISKGDSSEQLPAQYVELGDLNYPELLKSEALFSNLPRSKTGDIIASTVHEELKKRSARKRRSSEENMALQEAYRGRDTMPTSDDVTVVSGAEQEESETIRISGTTEVINDEKIIISGETAEVLPEANPAQIVLFKKMISQLNDKISRLEDELSSERMRKLKSGKTIEMTPNELPAGQSDKINHSIADGGNDHVENENNDSDETVIQLSKKKKKFGLMNLVNRISEVSEEDDEEDDSDADEDLEQDESAVQGWAKKIWDLRKKLKSNEEESWSLRSDSINTRSLQEGVREDGTLDPNQIQADPLIYGKELLNQLDAGGMTDAIRELQKIALGLKKSNPLQQNIMSILDVLIQEKQTLKMTGQKINLSSKRVDLEFKNKENSLTDELNRKGQLLKQKESALQTSKDQLSQLSMNMERVKGGNSRSSSEALLKKKHEYFQKVLQNTQRELDEANKTIEKMKSKQSLEAPAGPSKAELEKIKELENRHRKQIDEMRRVQNVLSNRVEKAEDFVKSVQAKFNENRMKLEQVAEQSAKKSQEIERLKRELSRIVERKKESA